MTPKQIELVTESWASVEPISDKAAELFYRKLFELDPDLKPLFKADMAEQGHKLMTMLNTAVNSLDNLETILPALEDLGKRHVDYHVKEEHYATVASALLWTLETGLGDAFTDDVKEAWTETYTTLSTVMLDAAKQAA